jgi:uncharacterized tellurite resistance protein B-like protein
MDLTWYPPGQSIFFEDIKLLGGMFYSTPKSLQWPGEPSAIVANAPTTKPADHSSSDLGYYPSYQHLTPTQRRAYLEWLGRGRRDPQPEQRALGHLFLFFYGIERRIILDKDREPALIEELLALLQHYGPHHKSRSFRSYFSSLAHYGSWLMGPDHYRHYWPRLVEIDEGKTGEEAMKLVLANLHVLNEPLHWSIAYRLALADQNTRKSVVVTRTQQEFWSLFQNRYENEYPSGFLLKTSKQSAVFHYQPASQALLSVSHYGRSSPYDLKIPNVAGLHSQFSQVSKLWNSCVDDLSGYSKTLTSKKQANSVGVTAWMALPSELKSSMPNPMQPFWEWMTTVAPCESDCYFIQIGYLAPWFAITERSKVTKAQASEIAYGIASMGWTMAPHPGHVDQSYGWSQEVAIYRRNNSKPIEPQIPGLVRLLYLIMPLAAADGTIDPAEIDVFHRLISHEITNADDWKHLLAVEAVLMRDTNVAVRALASMTKHIHAKNRSSVFHLLVHVAAADGEVAPEELKMLRKIARGLELEPDTAERILRDDVAFREITIADAKPLNRQGETIPAKPQESPPGLQLDMDRIAALSQETHEVVSMLAAVMVEEEELAAPAQPIQTPVRDVPQPPEWASGIAVRYQAPLVYLVAHDEIDSDSFDQLAAKHHLMPEDLFDAINSWSDETLGDFLLERSDPIRIYRNLMSSILPN